MPSRSLLPLCLFLGAGAASAQSFYQEQILYPTVAYSASQAHASPVTVDVSAAADSRLAPGSAVVTFASAPAPYVRVDVRSTGPVAVVNAQLRYEFSYTGAAMSYVPINFRGLFDIQHGLALFNRSEVEFAVSTSSVDFRRSESVGVQVNCEHACRYAYGPTATSLSSLQAPFTGTVASSGIGSSSAKGSFSGMLMGSTDANGRGKGFVTLRAFASGAGTYAPSWAFVDPSFTIDASYLAAHPEASLTLPPGVGNAVSAVPELQTQALLLVGLAVLGGAAWRRQRVAGRRVSR